MIRLLLLMFVVFFSFNSRAGKKKDYEAVNYDKIESAVKDSASEFYYPMLWERFMNSDTSLTIEEKRHIYYGRTFQPTYSPYGSSDFQDSLRPILRKQDLVFDDYVNLIRFSDSVLAEYPFNLDALNYQMYAYEKMGERDKFNENVSRMTIILDAIFSSGDGLKKKSAYYVISVGHEYAVLNILGYDSAGQSLTEHYDYLRLEENEDKIKGLYFEITPCLKNLSSMFGK